jgi:hypothetical protein
MQALETARNSHRRGPSSSRSPPRAPHKKIHHLSATHIPTSRLEENPKKKSLEPKFTKKIQPKKTRRSFRPIYRTYTSPMAIHQRQQLIRRHVATGDPVQK